MQHSALAYWSHALKHMPRHLWHLLQRCVHVLNLSPRVWHSSTFFNDLYCIWQPRRITPWHLILFNCSILRLFQNIYAQDLILVQCLFCLNKACSSSGSMQFLSLVQNTSCLPMPSFCQNFSLTAKSWHVSVRDGSKLQAIGLCTKILQVNHQLQWMASL